MRHIDCDLMRDPVTAVVGASDARASSNSNLEPATDMGSQTIAALYVLLMIATVVVVDVLFFRNQFWPRLMANIGIVLVFAALYFRVVKRP